MAGDSPAFAQPATHALILSKEQLFAQKDEHLFWCDTVRGRPCDPLALQRKFPDQWMAFLRANFRNPVDVAFTFGVTEKAADKWWHGIGGPQGSKVALAFAHFPTQACAFLSKVA